MSHKYIPLTVTHAPVILDTDIGPDCDDVGALVNLISYAGEYGFDIIGVCNCTSNKGGNGTVDAVARFCGYDIPAIGQWSKPGFMDSPDCRKYNTYVAENFSESYADGTLKAEDSTVFYRRLLSSATEKVTVIAIGMLNDLAALLDSEPDGYSPLTGTELVAEKVGALISMATTIPQGRECNIINDVPAAKRVLDGWPTDIYMSDFHVGVTFKTGFEPSNDPEMQRNPIYKSYELYTGGVCRNCSFDLTAVQFAVYGEGEMYSLTQPCRVEFYEEIPGLCDATRMIPDENGRIYYMVKNVPDEVLADDLNRRIRAFR